MTPKKILKIDDRLPKIILPKNKLDMFANWWNTDIRFEESIPHSFNEGYLYIENGQTKTVDDYKELIKFMARACRTTYREIENALAKFLEGMTSFILHFTFVTENSMRVDTYDGDEHSLVSTITFELGSDGTIPPKEINLYDSVDLESCKSTDDILNVFNYQNLGFLITSLWYIATTTRSVKYIYTEKKPAVIKRHKHTVLVSDTKTIDTPIYDMRKIRVVKVDSLKTRKKGWTYSHSFQVHGHYRHYNSGKTIFIKPYIKGKEKEFKSQTITLSPREAKK